MSWTIEQQQAAPRQDTPMATARRSVAEPEPVEVHADVLDLLVEGLVAEESGEADTEEEA